jgi:hypothetical protein
MLYGGDHCLKMLQNHKINYQILGKESDFSVVFIITFHFLVCGGITANGTHPKIPLSMMFILDDEGLL